MHIIIIARHYPPEISGGARRPFLYAQSLRAASHRVTVISPFETGHDDDICVPHPALQTAAPPVAAKRTEGSSPPARQSPLRKWARQWLLWPDANIRWARRVLAALKATPVRADWVMTTSPPESVHCIGAKAAQLCGARWIAEFRDTWITASHRSALERSALRRVIERRIARKALVRLDAATGVSEAVMADIRPLMPHGIPELITGHFSTPPPAPTALPDNQLHLVHAGGFSLSDRRRELAPVLAVLRDARRPELHLHIAGRLSITEQDMLRAVTDFAVTVHGPVSLAESQALQAGADALLLITPPNSHALPGKYAEYRQTRKPILYQGGGDWLSLVDDPAALRPLGPGLKTLIKGESLTSARQGVLKADDAAARLIRHLSSLT